MRKCFARLICGTIFFFCLLWTLPTLGTPPFGYPRRHTHSHYPPAWLRFETCVRAKLFISPVLGDSILYFLPRTHKPEAFFLTHPPLLLSLSFSLRIYRVNCFFLRVENPVSCAFYAVHVWTGITARWPN